MKEHRFCGKICHNFKKAKYRVATRCVKYGKGNVLNPESEFLSHFAVGNLISQTDQCFYMRPL
jgi:hypothetical protein